MCNEEPLLKPEAVYTVKETCAILDICKDTLNDRRKRGMITPTNPDNKYRYKYTGCAIRKLWRLENNLPL